MAPPSLVSTMSMSVTAEAASDSFVSPGPLLRARLDTPKKQPPSVIISDNVTSEPAALPGGPLYGQDGEYSRETPAAKMDARGTKILSYEEISRHRIEEDAWIVVDGKVYDVTNFIESHPGGPELLSQFLQLECSNDAGPFMRGMDEDAHSHSNAAFGILAQFLVGSVEAASSSVVVEASHVKKYRYDVDLTKPVVAQVGHLGADYDEWVHDPIVCKQSPRFFENDICEFFTRTSWWIIPIIWCPVAFVMIYIAVAKENVPLARIPFLFVSGVAIWTFVEYVLHRFLFHMKTSSFWGNTLHYLLHGFHHKHPMDGARLVFPPAFSAVFCVAIWIVLGQWVFSYPIKLVVYGSSLLAYVAYDLTHYFLHFGTAFNAESHRMKMYHLSHHFKDHTNGYGITTTIWDLIFETRLRVPSNDRRQNGAITAE